MTSRNTDCKQSWKVLGVEFNKRLKWNAHMEEVIKSSYSNLACLWRLKQFALFSLRKQLAKLLVLSKLDYCNCLYGSLPNYLVFKRLQKVQNATAGFVTGNFAKVNDAISLEWLPIKERIEFSIGKLAYSALQDDKWPGYLLLQVKKATRVL